MNINTPSRRQMKVYECLKSYIEENGIAPTLDEIRKKLKLKSKSTVYEHIQSLKQRGYIDKENNLARALILKKHTRSIIEISIIGTIAAGKALEANEEYIDSIFLDNDVVKNDKKGHYALRVSGNSMEEEGIFDGDVVIIKRQSVADNGQTVVAIIDDNQATLKKIYRESDRFRLEPRNQSMLPFYRKEVEIRGVVVQIISNFKKTNDNLSKKNNIDLKANLKTIDLFAGVGGLRLGFERNGFETLFANDFEKNCKVTYDMNFDRSKLIVEDINRISIADIPKFDFLLAGFPCQAFSIAGYRQGFNDKKGRGNLFFRIVEILEHHKPAGFLLENVKNLKSHDNGRTFRIIEKSLKDLGYHLRIKVLNSMEYGNIPQNRERIYIVGFKDIKHWSKFEFPYPIKLTTAVKDILEKNVNEKYYYENKPLYMKLKPFVNIQGKIYQWRRQYVRENKKGVCPTLTANMGTGGHNVPIILDHKGIRKLTPYECARLQGFPASYKLPAISDSSLYKQFGNSVTVPVVERIASQIKKAISLQD